LIPVGVGVGVERAHVVHLLQVDVREDELVVAGVDHGRPIRAGKHVRCGQGTERAQHCRLGAQGYLLLVRQVA